MSTDKFLRRALNGYSAPVSLKNIPIYHWWDCGISPSEIGSPLDKDAWIAANVNDKNGIDEVSEMLQDWTLYKKGWVVRGDNYNLFGFKCQWNDDFRDPPPALIYLEKQLFE